jgi:hypothetical protein
MSDYLLDELRMRYEARIEARQQWIQAREAVADARMAERAARDEYDRATAALEHVERELLTGETGLPLFGRTNGRPPDARPVVRQDLTDLAAGWTLERVARAIAAVEGSGGDGTLTVICRKCGRARYGHVAICPSPCLHAEAVSLKSLLPYIAAAETAEAEPEPEPPAKPKGKPGRKRKEVQNAEKLLG